MKLNIFTSQHRKIFLASSDSGESIVGIFQVLLSIFQNMPIFKNEDWKTEMITTDPLEWQIMNNWVKLSKCRSVGKDMNK